MSTPVAAPYCDFEKIGEQNGTDHTVLGVVEHSNRAGEILTQNGHPGFAVHTTTDQDAGFAEVWRTSAPTESGVADGIGYARTDDYLFVAARVPEALRYADATEDLYVSVFDLTRSLGYHKLLRAWAYISHINGGNGDGLEVYRDFCVGRARAVEQSWIQPGDMPAATGIGAHSGGIACYFLAARNGVRMNIENPRVLTAHRYPELYGPKPPVFARATYACPPGAAPDAGTVYVSATASIIGHQTVNEGNLVAQCGVAFDNIAYVLGADNLGRHGLDRGYKLSDLDHVKVYVRRREDVPEVRTLCAAMLAPTANVAFLHTDIARADLLVEIEGVVPAK
jgi:chorismatase